MSINTGDRVRFQTTASNGATVRFVSRVIKVVDGVAYVRHPEAARAMPFSPCPERGLYKYAVEKLAANRVAK